MRSDDEIRYAVELFDMWIDSGFIESMETECDAKLVYAVRECLRWVSGKGTKSFISNLDMFREILLDNDVLKLN